jgi:cell wall-associated NlpC family hydrolase
MKFLAAGKRCAVNFNELNIPVTPQEALAILEKRGYHKIHVDFPAIIAILREHVGKAKYSRGASLLSAPELFDCSSLARWAYSLRGIKIPTYSIAQRAFCPIKTSPAFINAGDLVFTTGKINYYETDPMDGVGHVGIATGEGTVIHAAGDKLGLIESPYEEFVKDPRGIRRMIDDEKSVVTIESPSRHYAQDSDEFRWIILQHC